MSRRIMLFFVLAVTLVLAFASCGNGNGGDDPVVADVGGEVAPQQAPAGDAVTQDNGGDEVIIGPRSASGFQPLSTLPSNAEGTITVLTGGNNELFLDITAQPLIEIATPENWGSLLGIYKSARAFQELFPYIRFNVMAVDFYKNASLMPFSQGLLNTYAQWGMMPDMWETHNLVLHVLAGEISDLSRFSGEESFNVFNETLMDLMNYYGFQGGLPAWYNTWSVVINTGLADELNIEIPPFNWNMDQYVNFISNADMVNVLGDIWTAGFFVELGARDVAWSAVNYGRVNFDTPEVRRLLELQHRSARYTLWSNWDEPAVLAMIEAAGWWDQLVFANNQMLANNFGGWAFANFGNPYNDLFLDSDWDMWPMPGSNEMGPSLANVFDPVVIRNFAGDPNADHQLDITYAFMAFMYGSLEGFAARQTPGVEILDEDGNLVFQRNTLTTWPVVRQPYFDQQMEIWYGNNGEHFRVKPGFQNLMRLFNEGQLWSRDARTFPGTFVRDGMTVGAFDSWYNRHNEDMAGVPLSDPAWPDRVMARLAEWTEETNEGLRLANESIREALTRFYGFDF